MYSESEIKEDIGKLHPYIDALADKYGDKFSCVLSAGIDMEDTWAGSCLAYGEPASMHQTCHALLENPKFIDEFFNAVECVILRHDRPEILKRIITESVESMKRMLIMETEQYKKLVAEKEADKAVQDLLKQVGFAN